MTNQKNAQLPKIKKYVASGDLRILCFAIEKFKKCFNSENNDDIKIVLFRTMLNYMKFS